MNIYTSISELVGKTPLLEPRNYAQAHRLNARLLLKLDHLNPAGSMKDRIALAMINEAEASGQLKSGSVIIEPTSGNTGIGLAAMAPSFPVNSPTQPIPEPTMKQQGLKYGKIRTEK